MCKKKPKHISFLLGAGFSVPAGCPTASKLNKLISSCEFGNIGFSPSGQLCMGKNGSKPDFGYRNNYDYYFGFLQDVIAVYLKNNCEEQTFDYEKFYDYLKINLKEDANMLQIYNSYEYKADSYEQYCFHCEDLYNQLLFHFLKDCNGNWNYANEPFMLRQQYDFPYQGFLDAVECFSKETIVDIHTLNHDLYIDRLKKTEWINGNMCDGFEELGSPFYGEIEAHGRKYKCRLEYFTNIYHKPIRLYKLHGSLDYFTFYDNNNGNLIPSSIVKSKYGVDTTNLLKEIDTNDGLEYDKCWINYHPNFLSGTTSKILQYGNPILYKKLFDHFKENLNNSNMLIIIGYSGCDSEVNRIIDESKIEQIYVIDKTTNISNHPLVLKGATPINKGIESLTLDDLDINKVQQ